MKPTWRVIKDELHNCECLICEKKFSFYLPDHFNMDLVTCPTCNQQVWAPSCPNGCPSFDVDYMGDSIKFDTKGTTNEEHS